MTFNFKNIEYSSRSDDSNITIFTSPWQLLQYQTSVHKIML